MMNDNEIIKALRQCETQKTCSDCPYFEKIGCKKHLYQDAFNLINRQKAEIERLNKLLSGAKDCIDEIEYAMEKVGTSNDRIDEAIEEWGTLVKELTEQTTFEKVEHNSLCETETYKGGE